jgi:uncharacterized protein DUF4440
VFTRMSRLPSLFIILAFSPPVNPRESVLVRPLYSDPFRSRYNLAMRLRTTTTPVLLPLMLALIVALALTIMFAAACTLYGEHPARSMSDATGGESLERVFWKNVAARNWVEIERALASNYAGVTPAGTLDREAALAQYRQWQLNDYSLGDLNTELNGNTIVVTYTITLNGIAGSAPLPPTPQHMMTVWQQQKAGWVVIAHSVSQ